MTTSCERPEVSASVISGYVADSCSLFRESRRTLDPLQKLSMRSPSSLRSKIHASDEK